MRPSIDYQRAVGAPAGRGGYRRGGRSASRRSMRPRLAVARLAGRRAMPGASIFTLNGTDALNLAIPRPAATGRPRRHHRRRAQLGAAAACELLERCRRIDVTLRRLRCRRASSIPTMFGRALRAEHAAGGADARLERDRRHAAGGRDRPHRPRARRAVSARRGADARALAARRRRIAGRSAGRAGHKGLLGPLGTGVLYIRPGRRTAAATASAKGHRHHSEDDASPTSCPTSTNRAISTCPASSAWQRASSGSMRRGLADVGRSMTRQLDRATAERAGARSRRARLRSPAAPRVAWALSASHRGL